MEDSLWDCLICGKAILDAEGVSLDASTEFHLCRSCWNRLPPSEKLSQARAWRENSSRIEMMRAFERLCRAALGSDTLSILMRGDRGPN